MKNELFIFLSILIVMLSASTITAADTNNLNATDAADINDATLAVENIQLEPVNADVDNNTADTQNTQPKLSADDLIMCYNDGSRFACKLVDSNGDALSGEQITFIVNGILYNRTTNNDGIAGIPIKLPEGNYVITSQYGNELISNKVIVNNNNFEINPEFQEILDNLPFEIDPSLIPLLLDGVTPQIKNTEPVADSLKDLQKLIDETPVGSTLTLTHNYYRDDSCTQLNINKDITIDGNGYAISFGGLSGHVISKKGNVVLKNLEITSAYNDEAGLSTLEILETATYILDSCKFNNNRGAGAIYIGSPSMVGESTRKNIIIKNCCFNYNDGTDGGAISSFALFTTIKIENTTFNGNCGDKHGGAIFTREDVDLKKCTFKNNYVAGGFTPAYGGAIFAVGKVTDDGSSFISNTSPNFGGAIVCTDEDTKNTHFEGNKAGKEGDDILVYDKINRYNFPQKDKQGMGLEQIIRGIS